MRAGLVGCFMGVKALLPSTPALRSFGSSSRELKICHATRRSEGEDWVDYSTLPQVLHVIPEPTDPAKVLEIPRGEITTIPWSVTGNSMLAEEGDMLILKQGDCANTITTLPSIPAGPSGRIIISAAGVVNSTQILLADMNELNAGRYMLCFATRESAGDSNADFNALATPIEIFIDRRIPSLEVSPTVTFGHDIVVGWHANNKLSGRISKSHDWIGLYRRGDCEQTDYFADRVKGTSDRELLGATKQPTSQNQCFIAAIALPSGKQEGEVRFTNSQYKNQAGEYEVRYFFGDSTGGAGYVCRGMQELGVGTYRICALEAKATSAVFQVAPHFADGTYQHLSAQENVAQAEEQHLPGLETFCFGHECEDV